MEQRAVIFDVYGTLVEITDHRKPYSRLLQLLEATGRARRPTDATTIMSRDLDLAGTVHALGEAFLLTNGEMMLLEQDLQAELDSVRLFPDVLPTLEMMRQAGLRVGVCSNLAAPYAEPVKRLLPDLDVYGWSFELGLLKPAPEIYLQVCSSLGVMPADVLMVGDTLEADVLGPRRAGLSAVHLMRTGTSPDEHHIKSLQDLRRGIPKAGSVRTGSI